MLVDAFHLSAFPQMLLGSFSTEMEIISCQCATL
jgi:hypothetical protein